MALPTPNIDGFSLHVTVYIDNENVTKFFEAMNTVFNEVNKEPELLYFEIFQDPENPGTISWVENWAKSPAKFFEENLPKDYYKPYFEATEPMFVKPREFKILKRVGQPFIFSKPENLK